MRSSGVLLHGAPEDSVDHFRATAGKSKTLDLRLGQAPGQNKRAPARARQHARQSPPTKLILAFSRVLALALMACSTSGEV